MEDYKVFVHSTESKLDGVTFYMVLDGTSNEEFKELVYARAKDIYGDNISENVKDRIEIELKYIFSSGSSKAFMTLSRVFRNAEISELDIIGSGSFGTSFIGYLLGINGGINPLSDAGLSLDPKFCYGENGEKVISSICYNIIPDKIDSIRIALENEKHVKELTECGIKEVCFMNERFTVYERLNDEQKGSSIKKISCDIIIGSGNIFKVEFRFMSKKMNEIIGAIKKNILPSFYKKTYMDLGETGTGLKADDLICLINDVGIDLQIPTGIFSYCAIRRFDGLVKLLSLCKGSGVWTEEIQKMIYSGKISFDDLPCTREGVYRLVSMFGMENVESFKLSERIRKGKGLLPDQRKELNNLKIDDWLIKYFDGVKYLPSEADCISLAKQICLVMRYRSGY